MVAAALLLLSGCDAVPRDSHGALDRIQRERVVRVGVVDNPPWTRADGGGLEPALVTAWAAQLGAMPRFTAGDLDDQVKALHRREIDVLVAGLDAKTPYGKELGVSQAYLEVRGRDGKPEKHVMAATPGESRLLFSLDRFLKAQDEAALRAAVGAPKP